MFDALPADWQIVNMAESHLAQVRQVEIASYPFPWSEGIFKDCISGGYLCKVVLNAEGEVVAYAIVSVAVGECHILNICTSQQLRGQGIARWLLRYMLDEAITFDAKDAFLEVRPSNPAAFRLYESFGFAEVGRRRNYYPDKEGREDAIVMALSLVE
ncbi:MAG: ribosomal protein S18-alanine N-acetyltransferase [Pseudomonadales bacterium]|nr:ribosomal protein S18-alanine N-acetyltransferase [Pseudomonadales bacterium]